MLNRCVIYSDSGLTWELLAARPQTSLGGAKPSAPLDHKELEYDGQKACHSVSARLALADRHDIALACKECSRGVGKGNQC